MGDDGTDGRITDLISAAVLSGAYSSMAANHPEAARGLLKMRAKHHERVTVLCGEIAGQDVASWPRSL